MNDREEKRRGGQKVIKEGRKKENKLFV